MRNSTRRILMVLIGGYLAYTGFDLTRAVIGSAEKNKWMFLAFAFIFLVFGVALIVINIKVFIQEYREEQINTDPVLHEEKTQEDCRSLLGADTEEIEKEEEDREEESHCE